MAYPQGINFRETAGFVTDGTGEDNELSMAVSYPDTTAQGNTVGWEDSLASNNMRDRNAAIDRRLAGIVFQNSTVLRRFRFDLPSAGDYDIRWALGDTYTGQVCRAELLDTTTSLTIVAATCSAANRWLDAAGTELTQTTWPTTNAAITKTFATTILRVRIGNTGASAIYPIAHINVAAVAAAGQPTVKRLGGVPFTSPNRGVW